MNKPKPKGLLWVQICEARPNKMFTEAQRQTVRFLRFNRHVPCVACGKQVRIPWTMLCEFKAGDMTGFALQFYPQTFPPLTPVCSDHLLKPAWPEKKKPNAQTKTK
jgi:hypothetical protein